MQTAGAKLTRSKWRMHLVLKGVYLIHLFTLCGCHLARSLPLPVLTPAHERSALRLVCCSRAGRCLSAELRLRFALTFEPVKRASGRALQFFRVRPGQENQRARALVSLPALQLRWELAPSPAARKLIPAHAGLYKSRRPLQVHRTEHRLVSRFLANRMPAFDHI